MRLIVPAEGVKRAKTALVLHGLLGSARNWLSYGRQLSSAFPSWRFVLADLRGHGDFPRASSPPNSMEASVQDLLNLHDDLGCAPEAIIGHSLGGKVALMYAAASPACSSVWVLDSNPGKVELLHETGDDDSVPRLLRQLSSVPMPLPSRQALITELTNRGFSERTAVWMTSNVTRCTKTHQLSWRFDLPVVKELFESYSSKDSWELLHSPPHSSTIHFVKGQLSPRWAADPDMLSKLEQAPIKSKGRTTVHELAGAGHWVHVDQPDGLLNLLSKTFSDTNAPPTSPSPTS
eukprot:GILI01029314.1.p1 GENE.GILI01029314.1~~GILI01029314.1.p1  ORF type:complete len:305 (+),score=40.75 GILI01029314.1:43-915(+)